MYAELEVVSEVLSGTLVLETTIPILLCVRKTRPFAFVLGFCMHGSIAFLSPLFLFSAATLVPYFAFLDLEELDTDLAHLSEVGIGCDHDEPVLHR